MVMIFEKVMVMGGYGLWLRFLKRLWLWVVMGYGYGLWLWVPQRQALYIQKYITSTHGKVQSVRWHRMFSDIGKRKIYAAYSTKNQHPKSQVPQFVESSPQTYIKVLLPRASWKATQRNKDKHKKCHNFGSRGSYFAPKSQFAS